jgi:hypothetical protein
MEKRSSTVHNKYRHVRNRVWNIAKQVSEEQMEIPQ